MIAVQPRPVDTLPPLTPLRALRPLPGGSLLRQKAPPRASSSEVLKSLLEITQALTGEIETDRVYASILGVVRQVTGAQRVSLQLLAYLAEQPDELDEEQEVPAPAEDDDGTPQLVLVAGLGLPPAAVIGQANPLRESVATWVLDHRQPLLLNGTTHEDAEIQRLLRGGAPGMSAMCVPLMAKGHALGVLSASKVDSVTPFDEADRDFLAVLAGQAAIAIEHARLYSQAAHQSATDGLTGLLNFAAFQARVTNELDRAERTGQELTLLQLDLDGFKAVNDTYGHTAGDQLLRLIADEVVRMSIRPYDVACRPGGDEFSILLPHTTVAQATRVAERIRAAVTTCETEGIGVPTGSVQASIGMAHFPTDGRSREELMGAADNALYQAKSEGRNRVQHGTAAVAQIERDPRKLYDLLLDANTSTIEALAAAIDARDPYTAGHSRRVADYAAALATALGHGGRFLHDLRLACLFHDVGKIGVPDSILQKPGRLTDDEFDRMKDHAHVGSEMLARVQTLQRALVGIRHHHERWDGKGYPDALAGEGIPVMARIIAIADAYDAMTSNRVYRAAMLAEDVVRILKGGAGIQWDAAMVDVWVGLLEKGEITGGTA